jgi:hypothetical protein
MAVITIVPAGVLGAVTLLSLRGTGRQPVRTEQPAQK